MTKHSVNEVPVELLGFTKEEENKLIGILEDCHIAVGQYLSEFWEPFCSRIEKEKIINITFSCGYTLVITKVRLGKGLTE